MEDHHHTFKGFTGIDWYMKIAEESLNQIELVTNQTTIVSSLNKYELP
jgi:hypothetical protein